MDAIPAYRIESPVNDAKKFWLRTAESKSENKRAKIMPSRYLGIASSFLFLIAITPKTVATAIVAKN